MDRQQKDSAGPVKSALGEIFDSIVDGFGEAIADIRKKVVEEGFFGREVTPRHTETDVTYHGGIHGQPADVVEKASAFDALMKGLEKQAPEAPAVAPEQGGPER